MEFDHPWASMIALHVGGSKSYEFHIPAGTLRHDYAMQ
jgi:hypothetical protein